MCLVDVSALLYARRAQRRHARPDNRIAADISTGHITDPEQGAPMTASDTTPHEPTLGHYEGQPILAAGVTINNASGGLHEAVSVDPVRLTVGDTVHVVLRCLVRPPQFDPIDKDNVRGPLRLVNRLHAQDATFIDGDLVNDHLEAQQRRIDEAKGELQLPFDDDDAGSDGEPQPIGSVLDDALDLASTDGDDEALEGKTKAELVDLAKQRGIDVAGRTKADILAELAGGQA